MIALLDGDIYAYRSAASAWNDPVEIAIARMEEMIDTTLQETKAEQFTTFLSGKSNFRYKIYPEYKANRLDMERPPHLNACKQHLIEKYHAVIAGNCEADDLLGIEQCKHTGSLNTVICSIDKDLRMIPGNHYSFAIRGTSVKGVPWERPAEFVEVSDEEALRHFYYQLLVGDATDNLKGASGIGPVRAKKILEGLTTEAEMFEAVRDCYSSEEDMLMQGQCLWIWRKENDIWRFPTSDPPIQ